MITFKSYLTESRSAPLYHATNKERAKEILISDVLKPARRIGQYNSKEISQAISLTRSIRTASLWVGRQNNVSFELDQHKLTHNYKLSPVNMAHVWAQTDKQMTKQEVKQYKSKSSKYEELFEEMITEPIKPLSKYLKKIIVFTDDITWWSDDIIRHPLLYSWDKQRFINQ